MSNITQPHYIFSINCKSIIFQGYHNIIITLLQNYHFTFTALSSNNKTNSGKFLTLGINANLSFDLWSIVYAHDFATESVGRIILKSGVQRGE